MMKLKLRKAGKANRRRMSGEEERAMKNIIIMMIGLACNIASMALCAYDLTLTDGHELVLIARIVFHAFMSIECIRAAISIIRYVKRW